MHTSSSLYLSNHFEYLEKMLEVLHVSKIIHLLGDDKIFFFTKLLK